MNDYITRRQVVMAGQGLAGASAFKAWLVLPGNAGKSPSDYQATLLGSKGDPGGNVQAIGPFATASGFLIPLGTNRVQCSGFTSDGDGSYPAYKYDAAVNTAYVEANPRSSFISVNGRGFRLAHDGAVNSRWFGALGGRPDVAATMFDGGDAWASLPDDTDAFQAAIDYCIAHGHALYTPAGGYRITKPLLIAKWDGHRFDFCFLRWQGDSRGGVATVDRAGTIIAVQQKDTFAIGFQAARISLIEGISIYGQNRFSGSPPLTNSRNFVNNGVRDTRWSPYAGIAIDPFGRSSPSNRGGPWPGIGDGSIGYPGFTNRYYDGIQASSGIDFKNVTVIGFTVDVIGDPCGDGLLTSEVNFYSCCLLNAKAAMAVCQNQSRNWHMYGCSVNSSYYGITGINYGRGDGEVPHIYGMNMGFVKYLFMHSHQTDQLNVQAVHAESFQSLGFIGTGGNAAPNPASFRNCLFNPTGSGGNSSFYADTFLVTNTNVEFDSCVISSAEATPLRVVKLLKNEITQVNCRHESLGGGFADGPQMLPTYDGQDGWAFYGTMVTRDNGHPDGTSRLSTRLRVASFDKYRSRQFATPGGDVVDVHGGDRYIVTGTAVQYVNLGTLAYVNNNDGTGTLTLANAANTLRINSTVALGSNAMGENWDGSLTLSLRQQVIGKVTTINGSAVTLHGVPQHLASGSYAFGLTWLSRLHLATTMDVTARSTAVTNISAGAVDPTYPSWRAGDYVRGAAIVDGTYLKSVDTAARTAVLSQPATGTAAGMRAYDADLRKLAAGTAV